MTDILESRDCGNSPKNRFVQDVGVSLEIGEAHTNALSERVVWHGMTHDPIEGRAAVEAYLAARVRPAAIEIDHAISHGKVGAVSGNVTLANGHTRRFSHVLEFTSTKANCVATIKSYG